MENNYDAAALASRYIEANGMKRHALTFRMGIDAGFFAEFKYLVNAVIWCMEHGLRLQLYSRGANFAYMSGWTDYFVPFCREVDEFFNSRLNLHSLPPLAELRRLNPSASPAALLRWKLKTGAARRLCRLASLCAYGQPALSTGDLPARYEWTSVSLPELGVEGGYLDAFRAVATMLWRFNDRTAREIKRLQQELQLPAHYAATQIRGGDKVKETRLYAPSLFVEALERGNAPHDVVLLTDDYAILESVRRDFPQFAWHSLCTPQEHGYYNGAFTSTPAGQKKQQMVRFLAQVDAMMHADLFTGSITAGPSLFLLQMMGSRALPADCSAADLPHASQIPIPDRAALARQYLAAEMRND